jgi:flagellar motor switch protein FliM
VDGADGQYVLLVLPRLFAVAVAERVFGAPLEARVAAGGEDGRALSATEAQLITDIAGGWLEQFRRLAGGRALHACPAPEAGALADPEGASSWLCLGSEIECGPITGVVSVILAPSTARLLLDPAQDDDSSCSAEVMMRWMGDIPLELRGVLGTAAFTLDELVGLQVGDVIVLDRRVDDPVEIVLEGRPRFRARMGASGQAVALELVSESRTK